MKCTTLKVLDLNPDVPEDQIYDLLCEKFSEFSDVNVNIVQGNGKRAAYLYFKTEADALGALKHNSCIALFGYACRAVPVYSREGDNVKVGDEPVQTADELHSESFQKSEDGLGKTQSEASPQRQRSSSRECSSPEVNYGRGRGSYRGRRGGRWSRGRASTREFTGRSNFSSFRRKRGAQKPYILTKSGDHPGERKGQKPYLLTSMPSVTDEETQEDTANSPNHILYIGSMDPAVQIIDLKRLFSNFGYVLDVEIKNQTSPVCYAFVYFLTMDMARLAKQEMEGKCIGHTVPKLGFGKSVPSKRLWVGGLGPWTSVDMLQLELSQFGEIQQLEWPKNRDYAFVMFDNEQDASDALQVVHGSHHGEPPHRLRACYATPTQMNSHINYKQEFPKFPKYPKPETKYWTKKFVSCPFRTRFSKRRRSRSPESPKWRRKRRRERSRSRESKDFRRRDKDRSLSPRSRSRSRQRHSRSRARPGKRQSTPPYPHADSISDESSENAMSDISSETSSGGSLASDDKRKRRITSPLSRTPREKLMRNPSPPARAMRDERTVVLRSEPQMNAVVAPSGTSVGTFTTGMTPLPAYVPHVEASSYYSAAVTGAVPPPTVYPPPLHLPPPDFYMSSNPIVPQYVPSLVSYPPVASDLVQSVPAAGMSTVQPNTYLPSSTAEKVHQAVAPAQKTASPSVATKFPKVWSGAMVLRNAAFVVDLHLVSGSVLLVNSLLGSNVEPGTEADCPVLKIAQRLRLDDPEKLDELDRRLKKAGRAGCSVLLATSAPAQVDDDANVVKQYPLSNLVSYLLQKQVAAVVPVPAGSSTAATTTGVLHAFPPCQFATNFLHREAPGLPRNCPTDEELLVVLCAF